MKDKIGVAVVEPVGGHGGMHYYDYGLCDGLQEAGATPVLYTCDETRILPDLGYPVLRNFVNIYGSGNKAVRGFRFLQGLLKSLWDAKKRGLRVVHTHIFHSRFDEFLSVKLAKWHGFKVVVTVHDAQSLSNESGTVASKRIYKMVDMIIVHNQVSKRTLIDKTKFPERKVRIIPHGNYQRFMQVGITRNRAMQRLNIRGEGPVLLFIGQIKETKGLDILLTALPPIVERYPSLRLLIAGKMWKDDFGKYQEIIDNNQLARNVIADLRYIPDDLIDCYYRVADLIVLPYRQIYQSGVLLMAMSYGVPVLASDLAGMSEIIKDNENGYLFASGSAGALANKLAVILNDRDRLRAVGTSGMVTVNKEHDWGKIGVLTEAVYREICC